MGEMDSDTVCLVNVLLTLTIGNTPTLHRSRMVMTPNVCLIGLSMWSKLV